VLLVPPVLMMVVNAILLVARRRQLTKGQIMAFATYILLPTISIIIQMLFYGYYIIILGTSIAAFLMMTHVVNDQTEQYYRQEAELANMKNEIMLSQIQPHFMINTLGAIAHLCNDAPEAKDAIQTFSRYMRGNIDVLSKNSLIPFSKEVEHTNLYLQLEKLRFGDSLQVVTNLECEDFLIPTLTLQPLVENAVRHGVRGKPDGKGTVWITSRETGQWYEVSVRDDGPGFDPEKIREDGQNHIGLENVRERVRMTAGGELKIESEPGGGTTVRILLPKKGGDRA
jgi:sensor histidine kinase YesM